MFGQHKFYKLEKLDTLKWLVKVNTMNYEVLPVFQVLLQVAQGSADLNENTR